MFARRTESLDATEIEKLINQSSIYIFGKPNLINTIEKSLLSVTLTSKDAEIIGYASFYDYPNIPEIDSGYEWNELCWLTDYELANPLNSLFMYYFLAKPDLESSILTEIITTVFNTAPHIHFIFMNTDKGKIPGSLTNDFSPVKCNIDYRSWFGLKRESYMPTLFIRPAKQEDMDDLAPIFNAQSTILQKLYGEFYIAEMIAAQNETTKCIVAEVGGYAIGFLSVTTEANIDVLNNGFLLEIFNGFKKPFDPSEKQSDGDQEEIQPAEDPSLTSEHSVPVVDISDKYESSLSVTTTEKTASYNYNDVKSPTNQSSKSLKQIDLTTIPKYEGISNAVVIQLFAINETYEMRSIDFLLNVFELFPTKDYLLITVPFLVPEFPLLENFVRVTPRPGIILPHELYAFHKGSLISNFQVRQACQKDDANIEKLILNLNLNLNILGDLNKFYTARRYENGVTLYAYVAECLDQIVGVAVLKQEEDIEYIRSHYNIEDFIYFTHHRREEHGHIKHFVLNPIFKRLSKLFLKEIMRKAHKSSLYYPIYKPWAPRELREEYSLMTNLQDLVPIRPRRQVIYDINKLEGNAPTDRVLRVQEGYCLTHFNRKLTMEPKVTINARIVVVGASTTGLSFLESLVFSPHLKFNNLFLVSPNGLLDYYSDDDTVEQLMGKDFYFSKKKLELSALRIQINVIKGHMTYIDRKKKHIKIDNKYLLPYDHLIITTGLQYTLPCPTETDIKNLPITSESINLPSRRYSELMFKRRKEKIVSQNLLTINDSHDAMRLIEFVKTHLLNNNSKVIIYGHALESYCCIHTILFLGIYGHRIHFIKPPIDEECSATSPLNNKVIEEAVYQTLKDAGVSIHDNYCLAQFNDSDEVPQWISSASFTTHGPPMRLECRLFISYYKKVVNYEAFRAMNDSCLVFDARLVIDTFFHTNDVSIRAAGPVTKFKRRYYNEDWHHGRFNSKAVGEELSKVFLRLFDPTLVQITSPPVEEVPLIPMYNDPILKSCILPGGYFYLNVTKPNLDIPLETLETQSNYGTVFITGEPYKEEGYFRVHINQYNKVETLTCLRRKIYPVENYIQLYGIHERALNNLRSRFNENLIKDFYEFFDDTWAIAYYHDRFRDLKEEIKELLMTRSTPCNISFEETVRKMMVDNNELTPEQKNELLNEYINSKAKSTVDQRLISFIAYNYYHLPMYAKPDMV